MDSIKRQLLRFGRKIFYHRACHGNGNMEKVLPQNVSPQKPFPDSIPRPSYVVAGGIPAPPPNSPVLHPVKDVAAIRRACRLARRLQKEVGKKVKVGCTPDDLDCIAQEFCIKERCYPSPLQYRGFPKSICTSVNNVACHGIPDDRPLASQDILSIDVTVYLDGFHGDCCDTYVLDETNSEAISLMTAARVCRDEGIAQCGPGVPFSYIGRRIEEAADRLGVTIIPAFCGHGIGRFFHGPPDIFHFANGQAGRMETGMVFTVEPAIAAGGSGKVVVLEDGWTAVTIDDYPCAQFEHTVLVTDNGHEILTSYVTDDGQEVATSDVT